MKTFRYNFSSRHTPTRVRSFTLRSPLRGFRMGAHPAQASPLIGCNPDRRAERFYRPGVEGHLLGCGLATDPFRGSEQETKGEEQALAGVGLAEEANRNTRPLKNR